MRVLYVNNNGSGFANYIEIQQGTSVEQFFLDQVSSGSPRDFLIRVNRQVVAAGQMLQENDRISITPTKVEGATG